MVNNGGRKMANWQNKVKIKHLLRDEEDWESIQKCMNEIADVLNNSKAFIGFNTADFRNIAKGDNFFGPVDYANKLLDRMYDYADAHRIWIE